MQAFNYRFMEGWLGKNSMLLRHDNVWHKSRRAMYAPFSNDRCVCQSAPDVALRGFVAAA
jgi:cytochrome P450